MQIKIDAGSQENLSWLRIGRFELALNSDAECVPTERKMVWEGAKFKETMWRLGPQRSLHFVKHRDARQKIDTAF